MSGLTPHRRGCLQIDSWLDTTTGPARRFRAFWHRVMRSQGQGRSTNNWPQPPVQWGAARTCTVWPGTARPCRGA